MLLEIPQLLIPLASRSHGRISMHSIHQSLDLFGFHRLARHLLSVLLKDGLWVGLKVIELRLGSVLVACVVVDAVTGRRSV